MSETFLQEIADQLRDQNPPAETVQQPAAQTETVVEETPQVETAQAETSEPKVEVQSEEPAWYEKEEKVVQTEQKLEEKSPEFELDDDVKLILEYKKSGKTLKDFVKEYKVEDYSSWNDDKLVLDGLKEFMNLSEEEMEQAKYEFESATILQKKQLADTFRQKFEQKNEQLLKQLSSSDTKFQERQSAISNKFNEELESFSKNVVDQEVYGLKVTDEMSKDLKNFIQNEFTLQKEDGSFDIEKMYSIGLWLKYGRDLVKANITKAKNEGKEQVIREVSNPSKNNTGGGRVVGSGLEAAQEAFNTLFPG
jgi:tyrosine-protein phosphatase YwqE